MRLPALLSTLLVLAPLACHSQSPMVRFDATPAAFTLDGSTILIDPQASATVRTVTAAFASDISAVTGHKPTILTEIPAQPPSELVLVGVLGQSPQLEALIKAHKLDASSITGKWESALTTVVADPFPGVRRALIIAASDRRGAAYALFTISRQMGVSPWTWWADVPVQHHAAVFVTAAKVLQPEPSVPYRGIFLNDEDWGLRPWAAKKMDPALNNIGPNTYTRIFELLLRLHANTLWPAMHPGSLAFNAVPENAMLADKWGIIMGSSHSEALLRNNVGEWDEKRDGPWNYQQNAPAMQSYWDKRLAENGAYENFYTVGLRGVHDSGLEATGSPEVKARLVENVMADQRKLLGKRVGADLAKIPQVIWLYKESLDLYRVGMKVPDDVTLGWTDDNYGYIRQLPDAQEQRRSGGSGVYYHVSYWGAPHDYLWLCTTPPALIREEMTKAYDHGARKYWILNVGDLKPAELDIDYFMQLAFNEPAIAKIEPRDFLARWSAEQFPSADSAKLANILDSYYQLNFIRKPEFMGFNGYNDGINRTAFNPLVPNQNAERAAAWDHLRDLERSVAATIPPGSADAFFELIAYPVEAAAAQNSKFLFADRTFLDAVRGRDIQPDADRARAAYDTVQSLTARYNALADGKWAGIMSAAPRERHVFEMPALATSADADKPLPEAWRAGDPAHVISRNAAAFDRVDGSGPTKWTVLQGLGVSGASVVYGSPGAPGNDVSSFISYDFSAAAAAEATLEMHFIPTFPVDSDHRLRYTVSIDKRPPIELDLAPQSASAKDWATNVLRNDAITHVPLGQLSAGPHTLQFTTLDPGVILQHWVITYPNSPATYPVPPPAK